MSAGLAQLSLVRKYRTGSNDLLREFYLPCLSHSTSYDRAVGFFTAGSIALAAQGFGSLIQRNGKVRLVAGPRLEEADLNALERGYRMRNDEVADRLLEEITAEKISHLDEVGRNRLDLLTWLVASGHLELKIANLTSAHGLGIYHEKLGLFKDDEGNEVSFSGSSNESVSGIILNFESFKVFCSWRPADVEYVADDRQDFEALWDNRTIGLEVIELPDAVRRRLIQLAPQDAPGELMIGAQAPTPTFPSARWRHQDEAIERFLAAERGVLNMATGTGKTRTALRILQSLFGSSKINSIVISMDGEDLLVQWHRELLSLRQSLAPRLNLFRDYGAHKEVQDFILSPENSILLVSREAGSARDPLVSAMRYLNHVSRGRGTLLIHDEVHKLGSPDRRERLATLSDNIRYRLGLSATPEREYDNEGTSFIEEHIGPVLMTFEIDDAIRRGILAPFNYFPLAYELTDADRAQVQDVYRKKAAREAAGEPMRDEEVWIELARIYKTSAAKLPIFADFIASHLDLLERCIIFVETREYGKEVLDIVHRHRADFHTYFGGDSSSVLQRFGRGDLECLITCHRLSEGIDIRSLNTVVLFSSARARLETIQRIGRCLRIDPANPTKVANIVDFIRSSADGASPTVDEERSQWLGALASLRADGTS